MPEQAVRLRGGMDRVDTSDGRYYRWEGERYWSITTILRALPQPWMGPWVKKLMANYTVDHIKVLNEMLNDGLAPDEVVAFLKDAPDRSRDRAAYLGSLVHAAAEAHVLGEPHPEWTEEQAPFMESFERWLDEWKPEFEAIEAPCFSKTHRFAGTLDAIITVPVNSHRVRLLIDYKTSKSGVFPETALQLAAYRYSESFIGLPDGDAEDTPEVDGGAVVLLRPEGYKFVPLRCDQDVFDVFLYLREVFRWTIETERQVLGNPANVNAKVCARSECGHASLIHIKAVFLDADGKKRGGCLVDDCTCAGFRVRPPKTEVEA